MISNSLKINQGLMAHAKRFIPGGVNSPVRSFNAVGGAPVFIKKASGSRIYGEDGSDLIDYCLSWGVLILGHAHPDIVEAVSRAAKNGTSFGAVTKAETELALIITEAISSVERVRLTSSGTEAVMSAVRLARAHTGRDRIIKFEGAYHGHADYLLTTAGSGALTLNVPDSPGVPRSFTKHTITLPYNDSAEVERAVKIHGRDLAAIIVEPVMANCGVIPPEKGFLEKLRAIADETGAVLIFDEVITGFRLAYGGAQEVFGIKADITCMGKIVGGGLPIGAFGGREEIMSLLAPEGRVYQAGTLSGNPIAVAAGMTTLKILKRDNPYEDLADTTKRLCEGIAASAREHGSNIRVNRAGSIFSLFFTNKDVRDLSSAVEQDKDRFKDFFQGMLENGIYFSPSGFEADFLSTSHSGKEIEITLDAVTKVFKHMKQERE